MVLYKLDEFDPNYRDTLGGNDDIKGSDVYSDIADEKIGSVKNIMVDEAGHFRYLVVDTGLGFTGKQVLLPIGRARIDDNNHRIYTVGLSKEQAEDLPEFSEDLRIDDDYEEKVRGVYRKSAVGAVGASPALDASLPPTPAPTPRAVNTPAPATSNADYDRSTYNYQQEPSLYDMNEQDHKTFKLYEERLIANKTRVKAGEVAVGKKVETETARVSVPVEKERVVIERTTPPDVGTVVSPGEANFRQQEVAHMEIYEETPDIRKETVVREEIKVRKEVARETVNAEEQIRREELDVNTGDLPVTDKKF
jgi:uncharacterized protein (TIGR02271 family)